MEGVLKLDRSTDFLEFHDDFFQDVTRQAVILQCPSCHPLSNQDAEERDV